MTDGIEIRQGFPAHLNEAAARLYCEAFCAKLAPFLGPLDRAAAFLGRSIVPDRAFVVLKDDTLLGIAGFKVDGRGLFEPGVADFFREYGLTAPVRMLGLALLEREEEKDCLLMDGIAVDEAARGQGVGTRLLQAIEGHARDLGKTSVRLDVIDTNPGARRLYERFGFEAGATSPVGPLFRRIFPFRASTEMRKAVTPVGA